MDTTEKHELIRINNHEWIRIKANGQALVELAILGTVLLFCLTLLLRYGLSANQQQNMQMESFRKGFVRAASNDNSSIRRGHVRFNPGWRYENTNPALPSNHWRNVNYIVIEDKPILSASGVLPIAERQPVGDSIEALCTIDMFAEMEYGVAEDLPRIEYEINGKRYSFTIADFREYNVNNIKMRKKEDIPNWNGRGVSWRWKDVSGDEVKANDSVDIDPQGDGQHYDGYEQYVLEKTGDIIKIIDYQLGEINLSEKLTDAGEEKGGLKPDYNKRTLVGSSLTRQEDAAGITTTDNINITERVRRTIETRDGDYNVEDAIPTQRTTTWLTPHR